MKKLTLYHNPLVATFRGSDPKLTFGSLPKTFKSTAQINPTVSATTMKTCTLVSIMLESSLLMMEISQSLWSVSSPEMTQNSFFEEKLTVAANEADGVEIQMTVHETPAVGMANEIVSQLANNEADVIGEADRVAAQEIIGEPAANKVAASEVAVGSKVVKEPIVDSDTTKFMNWNDYLACNEAEAPFRPQ